MADNDLTAQFVFTLAQASTRTVTLSWETRDGTAVANIDYVPASGNLIFAPGEITKTVTIQVIQPATEERKFFTVAITDALNATVDETEPGQVVIMPNNVFRGPRGFKGDRGQRGMSTYEEAVANGTFTGTYAEWVAYLKVSSADNISFTQSGSGAAIRDVSKKLKDTLAVRDFLQLAPGLNDTAALQASINEAEARGAQIVEVDDNLNVPIALANRSRVIFRGDGKLSGDGAYRKQVFSWNAQSGRQFFNDLEPARHLQRFSVAKSPTVVLVGSSTGAWSPNSVDTASTVARMLSDRITRYNPEKAVKFHNRCIGAQSYDQLDGVPTMFPAWYTDHAKPWLDYIKDLSPDVVFIIMGSGDSGAMSYTRLKSVTDKINAFTKVPDIVYITQPSVNPDPHPNYAAFGTKDALEGRDYAAGLIRSFAQYKKYGMIDANRVGGIVLDGRDLLDTISERKVSGQAISGGEYSSPYNAHDFSFRVEFPGDAAAIDTYFLNAANPVFFRVGAGISDLRGGDIVFVRKNGSGNFRFELFAKNAGNYASIDTQVAFPTGPFSLDVFKSGNTVGVSVANAEDSTFMIFPIIAHGGEFPAQFGCRNGGGPFSILAYLNIGTPKQYLPALTSQQAWGEKSADATTQYPYGGNGVNHFSSLGTTFIYGPLLNREVLSAARTGDGAYTPTVGDLTNTVAPTPGVAMWSRVGDTVTVSGAVSITPQASGTVQVDLSLPVPSNLGVPADLAGTCGAGGVAGMCGSVWGNDATDRARVQFTTTVTTAQNVRYTFSYRIK